MDSHEQGALLTLSFLWSCDAFLPLSLGRINLAAQTTGQFCAGITNSAVSRALPRASRCDGLQTLRCAHENPVPRRRSGRGNKICILGGGFGGLNTALKLAALAPLEDPKAEITLIDTSER